MRQRLFGLSAVVLVACVPTEPDWLLTAPRFSSVRLEVVEPGGYGSLLNVPPGRLRATPLPLDTIELEWQIAAPLDVEVQPPIWLVCSTDCVVTGPLDSILGDVEDCPEPLPLGVHVTCRLGEGHRIRVGLAGAYTLARPELPLILVGSREADLSPATCLERLGTRPRGDLAPCIVALWDVQLGPAWAVLPFDSDAAPPPELLAQDVDVNPEFAGFEVTRQRGGEREQFVVDVGASVGVRRRDRLTVAPIFAPGEAQTFWITVDDLEMMPWSGEPTERAEKLVYRAWFSARVDDFDPVHSGHQDRPISWVVPDDVEPTLLFVDLHDGRSGHASAELLFVAEDAR